LLVLKLAFDENMVNSYTYTDVMVTMEPRNDPDPKPARFNAVGGALHGSTVWKVTDLMIK
jgi:hypothetical protein